MILTANSQGISANDSDRFTFIEAIPIIVNCDCYYCNDPVDMICNCYFACKTKSAINTFKLTTLFMSLSNFMISVMVKSVIIDLKSHNCLNMAS